MSEVYDDLLQSSQLLFALCIGIGRNLLLSGRTKKRSAAEKRGAISPLIYSRIITAWTLFYSQIGRRTETVVRGGVLVPNGL